MDDTRDEARPTNRGDEEEEEEEAIEGSGDGAGLMVDEEETNTLDSEGVGGR